MSKQSQLMEYITQDIIAFLVEDLGIGMIEAMHQFYSSKTYELLMDQESGLYLEGSAYVYSILQDEKNGVIVPGV